MADDKVTAYLAEVRERSDRPLGPTIGALPISNDAVRRLMESAGDVPRLLAAVGAVLELAHPGPIYAGDKEAWDWTLAPAAVREAISRALLGEGESGG